MELTSKGQEELDQAEEIKNLKKVEAAMFISGRFLSLQELVTLTDINPILLRELIDKLIEKYDDNSAIEIIGKEENWKMDVKQEYREMVNRLATGTAEFSKAEQETLAVIAYKQPVKQSVIIKIRGNKAYEHVNHFIELGLIRGKKTGHTKELSLSEDFYDYFNVGKKEDSSLYKRDLGEKRVGKLTEENSLETSETLVSDKTSEKDEEEKEEENEETLERKDSSLSKRDLGEKEEKIEVENNNP